MRSHLEGSSYSLQLDRGDNTMRSRRTREIGDKGTGEVDQERIGGFEVGLCDQGAIQGGKRIHIGKGRGKVNELG